MCVCFYRFGFALCLRWRLLRSRFAVLLPGTERARGRGRGWGWGAFFCCVLSQNTADNAKRTRVVTRAPSAKNACNGKIQTANAHKKQCTTTQTTCKQRANRKGKKCQPACLDPLLDIQAGRPAVACKDLYTLNGCAGLSDERAGEEADRGSMGPSRMFAVLGKALRQAKKCGNPMLIDQR